MADVLEIAQAAARAGGDVVARYWREGVAIRSKESYNLVSDADVESERQIVAVLREAFPDHTLLGEEGQAGTNPEADLTTAEHLWIVDPLDGTNNFAHGIDHFAVSVAYYQQGRPHTGVVYQPIKQDWFVAVRGQGATLNGSPLQVAAATRLEEVLVAVGFYYDRGRMMQQTLKAIEHLFQRNIHGIRRFGTASLDLAQVAMGRFGVFFEYELAPWDWAAGRLLVEEAGGRVSDCRGAELPIGKTGILATNGPLHEVMLDALRPYLP